MHGNASEHNIVNNDMVWVPYNGCQMTQPHQGKLCNTVSQVITAHNLTSSQKSQNFNSHMYACIHISFLYASLYSEYYEFAPAARKL